MTSFSPFYKIWILILNRYHTYASSFALLLFLLEIIWEIKLSWLQRLFLLLNHLVLEILYLLPIRSINWTVRITLWVRNFIKMLVIINIICHNASCRVLIVLYWSESIYTVNGITPHNYLVKIVLTFNNNQIFWALSMLNDSHGLVHVFKVLLAQKWPPQGLLSILRLIVWRCQMLIGFHSWVLSFSRA